MLGNPADGSNSAINVTPANPSSRLKQKRKNEQKKLKIQKNKIFKLLNKKKNKRKRKNKKPSNRRGRQVCTCDTPGIDHCLAGGAGAGIGGFIAGGLVPPPPAAPAPAPPAPPQPQPLPQPNSPTMTLAMQMSGADITPSLYIPTQIRETSMSIHKETNVG